MKFEISVKVKVVYRDFQIYCDLQKYVENEFEKHENEKLCEIAFVLLPRAASVRKWHFRNTLLSRTI